MSDTTESASHRRERSRDLTGLGRLEADVLRDLAVKGLLEQDRSHAASVYRPKATDEEVARGILDTLVDKIMGAARAADLLPAAVLRLTFRWRRP